MNRADKIIAGAIFAVVLGVTVAAAPEQGINRDEAVYMFAGEQYITYWEHLFTGKAGISDASVAKYWEYNHEHPPLMKVLYGLSWRLFHTCDCAADRGYHPGVAQLKDGKHLTIPLFDWESTAFRLPTIVCFALLCALVFLFFRQGFGGRAGAIAAALLTAAQPRAFFHAQTAGFDLPASMFWFATTFAYWRSLEGPKIRRAVLVGVLYGLFLATKLQSFFLPAALGGHFLWLLVRALRKRLERPRVWGLVAMAVLGPIILFLLWPWLWHDTVHRFKDYLAFHLNHVHYNFEYLGTNWNTPPYPWHEPLGMLFTTAPVILLALAAAGIVVLVRTRRAADDPRSTRLLIALAAFVPVALFFPGNTPIFGETKHWLATMPYLAICAGVAVDAIASALVAEWKLTGRARLAALAAVVVVAVTPAVVETARSHPYGLSHYNALAGGAPGGADLGMNRQFWGYSVAGLLDWFNERLPAKTKIYLHDWSHDAYSIYEREGRLRRDLTDAGMEDPGVRASGAALVIHERHFNKYEYMIWDAYQTIRPVRVLTLDGVPLVTVYARETP